MLSPISVRRVRLELRPTAVVVLPSMEDPLHEFAGTLVMRCVDHLRRAALLNDPAGIHARANTAIGGAGAIPQCWRALFLKQQKTPGELDHTAADPGVTGSGEPLFAPLSTSEGTRLRCASSQPNPSPTASSIQSLPINAANPRDGILSVFGRKWDQLFDAGLALKLSTVFPTALGCV